MTGRDLESPTGPGASLVGRSAVRESVLAVPRFPDPRRRAWAICAGSTARPAPGKSRQPLVAFRGVDGRPATKAHSRRIPSPLARARIAPFAIECCAEFEVDPGRLQYRLLLGASFAMAFASFIAPENRMPIDLHGILWFSVPLSCLWAVLVIGGLIRYRRKGLWLLLGLATMPWPLGDIPTGGWRRASSATDATRGVGVRLGRRSTLGQAGRGASPQRAAARRP